MLFQLHPEAEVHAAAAATGVRTYSFAHISESGVHTGFDYTVR